MRKILCATTGHVAERRSESSRGFQPTVYWQWWMSRVATLDVRCHSSLRDAGDHRAFPPWVKTHGYFHVAATRLELRRGRF
jgi:hypothetical protein